MIFEIVLWGFFSAVGWWGANYYLIDPYFPKHESVKADATLEDRSAKPKQIEKDLTQSERKQ